MTGEATWAAVFTTTAIEYTIVYDLDGGSWPEGYVQTNAYTVESAAIVLPAPTKEGYAFLNWTNALGQVSTGVAAGSTGDQSFGAVFKEDATIEAVDPGQSMSAAEKAANPPVAIDGTDFVVHFKGQSGVTYQLVAMPTCTGTTEQWLAATPVGTAVTCSDETAVLELKAPMGTDLVKFFKIKASK